MSTEAAAVGLTAAENTRWTSDSMLSLLAAAAAAAAAA
jgi:hypothetical protein